MRNSHDAPRSLPGDARAGSLPPRREVGWWDDTVIPPPASVDVMAGERKPVLWLSEDVMLVRRIGF